MHKAILAAAFGAAFMAVLALALTFPPALAPSRPFATLALSVTNTRLSGLVTTLQGRPVCGVKMLRAANVVLGLPPRNPISSIVLTPISIRRGNPNRVSTRMAHDIFNGAQGRIESNVGGVAIRIHTTWGLTTVRLAVRTVVTPGSMPANYTEICHAPNPQGVLLEYVNLNGVGKDVIAIPSSHQNGTRCKV